MKRIYLAGAVDGQPDGVVYDWRHEAERLMRRQAESMVAVIPPGIGKLGDWAPNKIIAEDLLELRRCDAVLLNATWPSFGTGAELYYAFRVVNVPVFSFAPQKKLVSVFIKEWSYSCYASLSEAVAGMAVALFPK